MFAPPCCVWPLPGLRGELAPDSEERRLVESEWRRDALERCLLEIDAQQHSATEALKHRAESYSTGVLASSGLIERLATRDGERQLVRWAEAA